MTSKPVIAPDEVRKLLELPGAMYVCVVDPSAGSLLIEFSRSDFLTRPSPEAIRELVELPSPLSRTGAIRLEDIIVTSDSAHHLIRKCGGPGTALVLVYLRLDRSRANLAMSRRALNRLDHPAMPTPLRPVRADPSRMSRIGLDSKVDPAARLSLVGATAADRIVVPLPRRPPAAMPMQRGIAVPDGRGDTMPPPSAPSTMVVFTTPAVLPQAWSHDVDTLGRLLDGLQKLG